jgi:Arc/MetJ-type ribon-helix-helix transcriptional regulator
MKFELKPELAQFVDQQVRDGKFSSADQVLEAGVARLMLDPESVELGPSEIADLNASLDQLRAGDVLSWSELSARLRRNYLLE